MTGQFNYQRLILVTGDVRLSGGGAGIHTAAEPCTRRIQVLESLGSSAARPGGRPDSWPLVIGRPMKLSRKLAFVLFLGMCCVLAVQAWITYRREVDLLERDMKRDQRLVGRMLAVAVAGIWDVAGEEAALEILEKEDAKRSHLAIRWTWLDAPSGSPYRPHLGGLARGEEVVGIRLQSAPGYLYTYVPVRVDPDRPAAIEIVESLQEEREYVRSTLLSILATVLAVAAVSGLLAMGLGAWFVGRPTRAIIERARRVGAGDLSGRLDLPHRDEFSELAGELNLMCDRLAEARNRVAAETAARIATIEQLRHADRLATVGQLASGIAHELGTPLNVVWARAKMIATDPAGSEAGKNARIIAEQSQQMTKIIRQLLDFARPRSPRKARVDLWQVVRETTGLLHPLAEKRGVSFVLQDAAGPAPAEVDAQMLKQVLSNLALNGIQAMPEGGKLAVAIERERARPPADLGGPEAEYIAVRVRDEGVGMDEETRRRIFEPFFTTKGVGEGTGLGLCVSLGIVKEHAGWIAVESAPGRGSCFSVHLPWS
jgi:signal transduction histidine kinase